MRVVFDNVEVKETKRDLEIFQGLFCYDNIKHDLFHFCHFTTIQIISHVKNQIVHLQVVLEELRDGFVADGTANQ